MNRGPEGTLWDPGAQNERTALAWVRTVLSVLATLLAVVKLAVATIAVVVVPVAVGGGVTLLLMLWMVGRRYRYAHRQLHAERPLSGAALPVGTATLTAVVGLAALAWVVST